MMTWLRRSVGSWRGCAGGNATCWRRSGCWKQNALKARQLVPPPFFFLLVLTVSQSQQCVTDTNTKVMPVQLTQPYWYERRDSSFTREHAVHTRVATRRLLARQRADYGEVLQSLAWSARVRDECGCE